MPRLTGVLFVLALSFLTSSRSQAAIMASSSNDFSNIQGQGDFFYGYTDRGGDPLNLDSYNFELLDVYNAADNRWEASDGAVGANNNDFLSLNAMGGHPTGLGPGGQDSIIWAVRRFVSPKNGLVKIDFNLHKDNVVNDRGGGITGHILLDDVSVYEQFINNTDDTGVQASIFLNVMIGSTIDFAIDPTGMQPLNGSDGIYSARADGSTFSAVISTSTVPEPSSLAIFGVGLLMAGACRRRRKLVGDPLAPAVK